MYGQIQFPSKSTYNKSEVKMFWYLSDHRNHLQNIDALWCFVFCRKTRKTRATSTLSSPRRTQSWPPSIRKWCERSTNRSLAGSASTTRTSENWPQHHLPITIPRLRPNTRWGTQHQNLFPLKVENASLFLWKTLRVAGYLVNLLL